MSNVYVLTLTGHEDERIVWVGSTLEKAKSEAESAKCMYPLGNYGWLHIYECPVDSQKHAPGYMDSSSVRGWRRIDIQ